MHIRHSPHAEEVRVVVALGRDIGQLCIRKVIQRALLACGLGELIDAHASIELLRADGRWRQVTEGPGGTRERRGAGAGAPGRGAGSWGGASGWQAKWHAPCRTPAAPGCRKAGWTAGTAAFSGAARMRGVRDQRVPRAPRREQRARTLTPRPDTDATRAGAPSLCARRRGVAHAPFPAPRQPARASARD